MPRLIFVNRYFHPDHSATSQILSDLTFHLAANGHQVHVITSVQIYDDPDAELPAYETINGVHVHRVASTRFGRSVLSGRAVDYLSFYRSVRRCLGRIAKPGDTVIAETDPPLLSIVVAPVARRRGARLVNWLQDIYPETAAALNVPLIGGPVAAGLAALRNRSLRNADATVAVGELMAQRVEAFGVRADRIEVITNWCDDDSIKPVAQADNPLRETWDLAGRFVFGYSGNLGRVHDYTTVLNAAERLRTDPRIVFLVIGGGQRFDALIRDVKARGLESSFRFRPYQDRAALSHSLGVADVHWLSLNPLLEGLIVPSKFYGIAAAGRPIVAIGDTEGEIARLVRRHRCGVAIAPGNAEQLAGMLQRWSQDPRTVLEMGACARQMLDAQFTRRQALARWSGLLDRVNRDAAANPSNSKVPLAGY
jgi:colanic acid biosynthesis glycosyl transferase WcaI